MVQAGGGSVQVWGAFHSGTKSPLMLPNRYFMDGLYRGILQNILVRFSSRHFGDDYRYQNDNTTLHQQNGAYNT